MRTNFIVSIKYSFFAKIGHPEVKWSIVSSCCLHNRHLLSIAFIIIIIIIIIICCIQRTYCTCFFTKLSVQHFQPMGKFCSTESRTWQRVHEYSTDFGRSTRTVRISVFQFISVQEVRLVRLLMPSKQNHLIVTNKQTLLRLSELPFLYCQIFMSVSHADAWIFSI